MARNKPIGVYLDEKVSAWLEGKALEGYKKSAFVRQILAERMRLEAAGIGNLGA